MAADRIAGVAGYVVYNGATLPITKWSGAIERKLADSTDTGDYNLTANIIGPTQIPVTARVNVDVEGRFRKSATPGLIAFALSGNLSVTGTLGLDASTVFCTGNFDMSNLSVDLPVDDVVTFKCTLMSNGLTTAN